MSDTSTSLSKPLTQAESDLLRNDGVFIMDNVPNLMTETLMWGFHIVAMSFAVYTLCQKAHFPKKPRLILLITILTMFLMSSTLFSLHIFQFMIQVKGIYLTPTQEGQSFTDKSDLIEVTNNKASFVDDILFALEFLIGDSIVLWRTWAIWKPNRQVVCVPIFLWVASLSCLLAWIATRLIYSIESIGWTDFNFRNDDPEFLLLTNYVLSLSVNATSTILIGYKAWQYHKYIQSSYENSPLSGRIAKTLALLVESGSVYLALFSVQLINFVPDPGNISNLTAGVIAGIGNQLLGLYPTLIIILVYLRRTIWDLDSESTKSSERTLTNIVFNQGCDRDEYDENENGTNN